MLVKTRDKIPNFCLSSDACWATPCPFSFYSSWTKPPASPLLPGLLWARTGPTRFRDACLRYRLTDEVLLRPERWGAGGGVRALWEGPPSYC